MKIVERLLEVHLAVLRDTFNGGHLGKDISEAAIKAVTSGANSPDWEQYMSLFADNAAQLNRLKAPSPNEHSYFPKGRAYIAANGTCGADTNGFTGKGVEKTIDEQPTLPDQPDGLIVDPPGPPDPPPGTVVRPFKIPI